MASLRNIAARAGEILKFSYRKENYFPMPEWDGEGIPPVEVHRANIANNALDMAGLYAAKAKAFAGGEDWGDPIPDWAEEQAGYMERDFAEYAWAVKASPSEIWQHEIKWYGLSA